MHSLDKISQPYLRLIFAVYLYVVMEWLFYVTKLSFLSTYSMIEQLQILLICAIPYLILASVVFGIFAGINKLMPQRLRDRLPFKLNAIVIAFFVTALTLLLVDNFTYTMFKSGIVRTRSHQVLLYDFAIIAVFYFTLRKFSRAKDDEQSVQVKKAWAISAGVLVSISTLCLIWTLSSSESYSTSTVTSIKKPLPNILFFASDGVDADHLSIYGYQRETTPNLTELSGSALIGRAALANAGRTTGSTTSMLTGKLPTTTKVLFPPHALKGKDAYQHLPGILKSLGYRNLQESVRYYADSADLNMRRAFDVANKREVIEYQSSLIPEQALYAIAPSILLLERMNHRLSVRVQHLLGIKKMVATFDSVKNQKIAKVYGITDKNRINRTINFMKNTEQPFFAHIHLMRSHCCNYRPKSRKFSKKYSKRKSGKDVDFYDDIILYSDQEFGRIVAALKESGKYDNTIIVYTSDHTKGWHTSRRVPLIFIFPEQQYAGNIKKTVQLMDVAPTILDYLELEVPDWMEGHSLLNPDEVKADRPIFAISGVFRRGFKTKNDGLSKLVGSGPPTFGMRAMGLTVCHRRYELDLKTGDSKMLEIPNHPQKCDEDNLPSQIEGAKMIEDHLLDRGFGLPFKSIKLTN